MTTRNAPRLLMLLSFSAVALVGCGGGGGGGTPSYTVSANTGSGGNIAPESQTVEKNSTVTLTLTPDTGYVIESVSGCSGTLTGNSYTTGAVTADCAVTASFALDTYTVSTSASVGGTLSPADSTVTHGDTTSLTAIPDTGFVVDSVSGCGGTFDSLTNAFTTAAVTADCTVSATFGLDPAGTLLSIGFGIKQLKFSWPAISGAAYYRLKENPDGVSGYTQLGSDLTTTSATKDIAVYSHDWANAKYVLDVCTDSNECITSNEAGTLGEELSAIGYFKPSVTDIYDSFGGTLNQLALSGDGKTLAVGALDDSGVEGDPSDNSKGNSGAVYVFTQGSGGDWTLEAFLKQSTIKTSDFFGASVAISDDGNTLAVGAYREDSSATGINGDDSLTDAANAGAVYVFTRSSGTWTQQAYIKASNTALGDYFSYGLALSGDGNTLAAGAPKEDSGATGIGGTEDDETETDSGAVYLFTRSGDTWSQQAYVKASNTGNGDEFGQNIALSDDGNTMAVGAHYEDGDAIGIDGVDSDLAGNAGAVYLYARSGDTWSLQAYVKASNTDGDDEFGYSVSLNGEGTVLVVGAPYEDGDATVVNGTDSDLAQDAGAAYLFTLDSGTWSQHSYLKAANAESNDFFGSGVIVSGDGTTIGVGAIGEDSSAKGVDGAQDDNSAAESGAVYLFAYDSGTCSQQSYIKASNTDAGDKFSDVRAIGLSSDGGALAVGTWVEAGSASGVCITGDDACALSQEDNSVSEAGAVYLY